MDKDNNNLEVSIPGLPSHFAMMVARVQGRDEPASGRLKLAKGQAPGQLFMHANTSLVNPAHLSVGQLVEGKGIYVGLWSSKDENMVDLGKVFELYAAPEDAMEAGGGRKLLATFNNAVRHVAELKNWHGHNGANFSTQREVYQAIRNGNEKMLENWFIPTIELAAGIDLHRKRVADSTPNLFSNTEVGDFKHTFNTVPNHPRGAGMYRYWTISTDRNPAEPLVCVSDFSRRGQIRWCRKSNASDMYSIRPVRAELRI